MIRKEIENPGNLCYVRFQDKMAYKYPYRKLKFYNMNCWMLKQANLFGSALTMVRLSNMFFLFPEIL